MENDDSNISNIANNQSIKWDRVEKTIVRVVYARLKVKGVPLLKADIEDISTAIMIQFLNPGNPLHWNPAKVKKGLSLEEGITIFLIGVAENKTRDLYKYLVRRGLRSAPSDDREESRGGDSEFPFRKKTLEAIWPSPDCDLMGSDFKRYLISLVPGDVVAIAVINAALETTGGGKVDQELAELVFGDSTRVADIVNAKKRIRRAAYGNERSFLWMNKKMTTALQARTTSPSL